METQERAMQVVEALTKRGYKAYYAPTKAQAREKVLNLVPEETSNIGFGGSITTRDLGLVEALREKGHQIFDHWQQGLSSEEVWEIRKQHVRSDVFFTSANAITLDGQIINIDGVGNRVSASIFGPDKIIMIAGINKIVENVEAGLERSQQVAAVKNASRLNIATPCAKTGKCSDCNSKARTCNISVILHNCPRGTDYTVIIVGEELGF